MPFKNVAIIGCGLSGLALALFLKDYGIRCTFYESQKPGRVTHGALVLSPNSLRSLDALGVYKTIKSEGFSFRHGNFNTNEHKTVDSYEFGNADKFGYDALRVYRRIVLDEMKTMVLNAGLEIHYEKKFSHVLSEDDSGVTFAFSDGSRETADLLIGADGIHSTVRKYLAPGNEPIFSNVMTVMCAIETSKLAFPFEPYLLPCSIHSQAGAFIMAPQNTDGSELMAGIQYRTHERDRKGWEELSNDKTKLLGMIREHYHLWNSMVRSAIDAIPLESLSIWPFYTVPKLDKWYSQDARVILLGDAAHAIPPSIGQGANQAFEDAHSLSILIAAVNEGHANWEESLRWWQAYRRARIDRAVEMTNEMNKRRMPGWSGEGAETMQTAWLYEVDVESDVRSWLKS